MDSLGVWALPVVSRGNGESLSSVPCDRLRRQRGRLVINAIRKESADRAVLASLDYPSQLWMEREIKSVANVTRRDVREFLQAAANLGLKSQVDELPLERANEALAWLRSGAAIRGSKVLRIA